MSSSSHAFAPSCVPRRVGRYVLFEELARGGMASIHLARLVGPAGFSRVVAVKRVRSLFVDSEDHRRALIAEARISSRIHHPNVVQTLDVVIDDGVVHLVMEYVHGVTAAELAREARVRGERAPIAVAIGIVADALQGLHAAHEARDSRGALLGIVHRDVSPQNVQVGADGLARLLDFGIAKAIDRTQVTAPGVVKGKLAYMSREQLGGAPVTRQADVYGMGVVLWELLAGRRLFEEEDATRIAARVLTETIPAPSVHAPDVPSALDQVVLRATAHDPRRRFETASEMLAALAFAAPRAEAHEIGAWMERLAGDQLELRAEAVRRAEMADVHLRGSEVSTLAESVAERFVGRRWRVFAGGAGVAVLLAGGALAALRLRADKVVPAIAQAADAGPSVEERGARPPDLPSASPLEAPEGAPDTPFAKTPPAASAPAAQVRVVKRHIAASPCDPPFSMDPNGRKHYKPECLR